MMRTRQQIPSGRHPHDRSAMGWRHDTAYREAQQIMKNRRGVSRLFFDEKGTAAIEFGLVATFLSFLFLGLADFGMAYWEQMQVGNAASAGAEYAINAATAWTQAGVTTAVTGATSLGSIQATPAPTQTCGCPSATTGITAATGTPPTCGSSCAGGGTAGTYVTVNAQASYSFIFRYPGIASPLTLTASTTVRIN